jgi:hypothetical protein
VLPEIFGLVVSAFMVDNLEKKTLPQGAQKCEDQQYFVGPIDSKSAQKLANAFALCVPKTLIITSGDGDERAALQIARILRQNGTKLEVKEACLSACAQIIMLSMPSVKIHPFTIIGFHHRAFAINEWSAIYGQTDTMFKEMYESSKLLADDTVEVVDDKSKLNVLRYSFRFVKPKCLQPGDLESDGQWKIVMARQFWFPRRTELERGGVHIIGDWENLPGPISGSPDTNFPSDTDLSLTSIGKLTHFFNKNK